MRLREIRESRGYSQKAFADKLGISPSTYNQYEMGKREPDLDTVAQIALLLNVSVDEILGRKIQTVPESQTGGVWIPVLGKVAAGVPITAVEEVIDYEEISAEMAASGEFMALSVKGDSMEPRIKNGDVVIVKLQPDVDSGQVAVVMVNGDEATVKKVVKQENGIVLVANNPAYAPRFYSNRDIEQLPLKIVGRVVELRGKF